MTDHAPLTREEEAAVREFFARLRRGECPHCGALVMRQEQVGRSVYARPCGHRLYQGRPGAFSPQTSEVPHAGARRVDTP